MFQRLRNLARERGEDINALFTQYAIERLLYRMSQSDHADQFILKGAMLFRVWTGALHRPTQDVDLLGHGDAAPNELAAVFARILKETDDPNDGIVFKHASIFATEILEAQDYHGVRLRIPAELGTAQTVVQVDVGFGDAVTPEAMTLDFPVLMAHSAPRLRAYPPETAIAEKLQAICSIGLVNSRMKDFYDLVIMSRLFSFDGILLTGAIRATFHRRGSVIPHELPIGLRVEFGTNPEKQVQWKAFLSRTGLRNVPEDFEEVVQLVRKFLEEPLTAAASGSFNRQWNDGRWFRNQ